MLFITYLAILIFVLDVGLELLAFSPFYVFFILIASLFPTLFLAFVRAINPNLKGTVLIVNTIHILLLAGFFFMIGFYVSFIGEMNHAFGYIFFYSMGIIHLIILRKELKRSWVWIMTLILFIIMLGYSDFSGTFLEFVLNSFPFSIYLIMQNVTVVSYIFLKERY